MLRISLTSIVIAVLLAGHPVAAKNEGNGGGHGGGNSGGHGNGGGGRDGGGSQGSGHGGDKGNGGGGDRGGNSGANGNSSGGGEKGGRGGQDGGGSRGGGGGQGGSGGKGGGSAEGRGSQGSSTSGGAVGGASNPNAGSAARGGAGANIGGRNAQEARSASPQAAPSTRASETVAAASLTTRESMNQVNLPSSLIPRLESSRADREDLLDVRVMRAGVSGQIVDLCRTSIAAAAIPYGAIRVDAAGAGRTSRLARGGLMAPLQVRIVYARANARQVRQSRVACQLNSAGAVVALR